MNLDVIIYIDYAYDHPITALFLCSICFSCTQFLSVTDELSFDACGGPRGGGEGDRA